MVPLDFCWPGGRGRRTIPASSSALSPISTYFSALLRAESRLQKLVVQRQVLAERARISLPAAATAELTVDTGRVVHFSADDVQPPSSATPSPSLMSVPRPAMFVETVTRPRRPAAATMSASSSMWLALRIWCSMPSEVNSAERCSDLSIERVPMSTGRPSACKRETSCATASHLASEWPKT